MWLDGNTTINLTCMDEAPFANFYVSEDSNGTEDSDSDVIQQHIISSQKRVSSIPPESEFYNMKLAPFPFSIRVPCSHCRHSCLMYCPFCMVPLPQYPPPKITLPIAVDIIHHPKEKKSKSTAVQAVVLCPKQVTMWEHPTFPTYDPNRTLCLFPSPDAKRLTELDLSQFDRAVFVDSTWTQTGGICQDPRVQALTKVKISNHNTLFWRYQHESPEFLSTMEAIYFFMKEFIQAQNHGNYSGEVDNLLWYYVFQYEQIQGMFTETSSKEPSKKLAPTYYRSLHGKEDQSGT